MNLIVILIVILLLAVLGKRLSGKNFSCTRHRPNLCLLASGVLPASERAALERHLAACPDCRTYFAEIQSVTASLEKLPAAQARATKPGWTESRCDSVCLRSRHFEAWLPPKLANDSGVRRHWKRWLPLGWRRPAALRFAGGGSGRSAATATWWQEVIWPYRRLWTGLAAAWVLIVAGNLLLREPVSPALAAKAAPSSQTMLMAFRDRQNTLTELLADPAAPVAAERRKIYSPRPHSEKAIGLA